MPMRNCPHCGNGVQDTATKCPHCGGEIIFGNKKQGNVLIETESKYIWQVISMRRYLFHISLPAVFFLIYIVMCISDLFLDNGHICAIFPIVIGLLIIIHIFVFFRILGRNYLESKHYKSRIYKITNNFVEFVLIPTKISYNEIKRVKLSKSIFQKPYNIGTIKINIGHKYSDFKMDDIENSEFIYAKICELTRKNGGTV